MNIHKHTPEVALIVLTEDKAVRAYAHALFDADIPLAVVSRSYSDVVPFMLGNNGHTVALVADVDDITQLAKAILVVENRLGQVASVVRYSTDLPTTSVATAA